jgi:ABC-2 type transport system permease protein
MISALKSEFRKLLTVRSSYVIAGIALALLAFVSLYIEGYKNGPLNIVGPGASVFLAYSIRQHAMVLSIFSALVALLLLTHEYRYNTIMYSLTATNRRSKVLAAKIIASLTYTFVLVLVGAVFSFVCMVVGLHLSGHTLPAQTIDYVDYFRKLLFFCEGYTMAALFLAAVLRNQVAAIAVFFIVPGTVENLLSLLLKDKTVYLPFSALTQVIQQPPLAGVVREVSPNGSLTPGQGALVFLAYLVVGWVIAWVLFLKRDAN